MMTRLTAWLVVAAFAFLALPAATAGEDLSGVLLSWPATEPPSDAPIGDEPPPDSPAEPVAPSWKFELSAYVWIPSLDATVIVEGEEVDAESDSSTSFADVFQGTFTGRLECWHGEFAMVFDLGWLRVGNDVTVKGQGPAGVSQDGNVEISGLNAFIGGAWRFTGDPVGLHPKRKGFFGDLLGGVRIYNLHATVERDGMEDLEGDDFFVEPVIGIRGGYHFGHVFSLSARLEAGGFGISNLPDYDVLFLIEGRFRVTRWLDLDAGWQWKWLDFSTGSGDDEFGLDVTYQGPWLGATFLF